MGLLFLDNAFEGFRHRGVRKIVWVNGRPVIAFSKPNRIVLEFSFICCNGYFIGHPENHKKNLKKISHHRRTQQIKI